MATRSAAERFPNGKAPTAGQALRPLDWAAKIPVPVWARLLGHQSFRDQHEDVFECGLLLGKTADLNFRQNQLPEQCG
jgi:hypothetical protein